MKGRFAENDVEAAGADNYDAEVSGSKQGTVGDCRVSVRMNGIPNPVTIKDV